MVNVGRASACRRSILPTPPPLRVRARTRALAPRDSGRIPAGSHSRWIPARFWQIPHLIPALVDGLGPRVLQHVGPAAGPCTERRAEAQRSAAQGRAGVGHSGAGVRPRGAGGTCQAFQEAQVRPALSGSPAGPGPGLLANFFIAKKGTWRCPQDSPLLASGVQRHARPAARPPLPPSATPFTCGLTEKIG